MHGRSVTHLTDIGIRRVLNLTQDPISERQNEFAEHGIESLHIDIRDHPSEDIVLHFDRAFQFIRLAHAEGNPVFVHCEEGKSRSTAFVLGYLIWAFRWTLKDAFFHVLSRRPIVSPNNGFMFQLAKFEQEHLGSSSVNIDYFTDPWYVGFFICNSFVYLLPADTHILLVCSAGFLAILRGFGCLQLTSEYVRSFQK